MDLQTQSVMRFPTATLLLLAATVLSMLLSGCTVIAGAGAMVAECAMYGAAMRPYDQALARGRMTPVEYRQQMAQVDHGMDAIFYPPEPVARRR